jgi:DNA repair photolyase
MLEIKIKRPKPRHVEKTAEAQTGNFILGCSHKKGDTYDNPCSYCYVARFGRQKLYVNTNTDELLAEYKAIQDLPSLEYPSR